jgi:DNA-binding beta-propeller fold protein YncE
MNVGYTQRAEALAAAALILVASGCAGASTQAGSAPVVLPPTSAGLHDSGSWISPEVKNAKALLYVGDPTGSPSYSGVIDILSVHGLQYKLIGQIQDDEMPEGMTTDAAGNLYVADLGVATEGPAPGDIKVYPKGSKKYSRYIVPADWVPNDIAVGRDGTMYVANIAPFAEFSPGSVSIYPPLASQPSRVLHLPNFQVDGITLHAKTNTIYISYQTDSGGGRIAEFKHARGKAIDLGVSYPEPWAILEDGSNNLLALDGSGIVEVYSEATGKLVQQIPVPNGAAWEAFNTKRSELFVSNFEQVEVLSYPAGKVLGSINEGWSASNYPTGVAYWPPP